MGFCGGRGRGGAGAAPGGLSGRGYTAPKGPEKGGRRPVLAGTGKITLNGVKTKGFKGIRGRIGRVNKVEINPWRGYIDSTPLHSIKNGREPGVEGQDFPGWER